MKIFSFILLFFLNAGIFFAQPRIRYDITAFDFGQLTQRGTIKKEFTFTNIGDEPVIISRTYTGDGGTWADYPKDPVAPGKTGTITFFKDGSHVGPFSKTISLASNAYGPTELKVKGEIIYKPTNIKVDTIEKNIGEIIFKSVDTVQFEISNMGPENLHFSFSKYDYPEMDMFYYKIYSKDRIEKVLKYSYGDVFSQPAKVKLTITLRNIYGNTGAFERKLFFIYNSHDTLWFKIKGAYTGKPEKNKLHDGSSVLFYENDKLVKREDYSENGNIERTDFFEAGYCVHSIRRYGEYFFKKGILINQKKPKTEEN